MNSKEKKQGGFTLAELLVVVAIIGVLVAVSIPIFTGQLEKSRNSTDLSNAKSIANAISYYLIANPDALSEVSSQCAVGVHNVQVSVAGENMAIAPVLRPALKQAGLIENTTGNRYTEITCKTKKKWIGYRIVVTTYTPATNAIRIIEPGNFEIYYWGVPEGITVHSANSLGQYQNKTDPTGFKDAMKGK